MGFSPQVVKLDRNILLSILGKNINVEVDDGYFVSGKLLRFERVGEARHKPFVLVLLVPGGDRVIVKWVGIVFWR